MKILSVDDNPENLRALENFLRARGHSIDSADDGFAALQLARNGQYDLILSEAILPRIDGFQLCRQIKSDARLRRVPFVFYTADSHGLANASLALSLGAERVLTKPLRPEALIAALEEVAAGTPAAPPAPVKSDGAGDSQSSLSHDLNNAIADVIGFAELGLLEAEDPLAARATFRKILDAARHARELARPSLASDATPSPPEIPAAPPAPAATPPRRALGKGRGERILFIDDEPVLAVLGERFLTQLGYTPIVRSDPHAALAYFRENPVDLVITDLMMPACNGLDLAKQLWQIRRDARIVLSSGFNAAFEPEKARELGFRELLPKPYSAQSLDELIQRALSG